MDLNTSDHQMDGQVSTSTDGAAETEGAQVTIGESTSAGSSDLPEIVCGKCDEDEAEVQQGHHDPGQPSAKERAEHDLTHCPFRAWCAACVRGQAKDSPSTTIKGLFADSAIPRVRMDYCFLTEEVEHAEGQHGESEQSKAGESLAILVMQESMCRSVWAYAVESKGAKE